MEQAHVYQYPPKIEVPRGLRALIEGLSLAVVQRRPESIPHFATLYFAELMRFRAVCNNEDIQGLVKQFHKSRVDRLPRCGLGTMKDVKAKKQALVAKAALFSVRAHTMEQISGSIPVKSADDDERQRVNSQKTNIIVEVIHTKLVSKRLKPPNDTPLTQEVAAGAATKPLPSRKKKKVECKLVKPAVLTEEPEIEIMDVCLTASGPQEETIVLVNPEERMTSHLACTPVSTSGLVYPPLPTEQEVYAEEQQMINYQSHRRLALESLRLLSEPVSQHRPQDSSATVLANDPHQLSLSPSDRKKNQGDHTLVRPIAPAEDPELFSVNNVEWTPPAVEEGEIAELMDKQMEILLRSKRRKVNTVEVKASTLTQGVLTSSSAPKQHFQGKLSTKLTESSFPEEMTETSSSQKHSKSGTIVANQVPTPQSAQQMVYVAFPMPYALLASGYMAQNSGPTATSGPTVPPTAEQQLQLLAAVLQPPQNAIHTSPGTAQSSPPAEIPNMVFPFMSPQLWRLCPVAQPHSTETPASQSGTAGHSVPCQATQQASSDQAPTFENGSTWPQMPMPFAHWMPIPCP